MNTLTDKQLEILVELLRWGKKIGIPDLREKLIQKGISVHINEVRQTVTKLEKMELINVERIPIGKKEYYRLNTKSGYDTFKKLGKHLLGSNKRFDFIESSYTQSIVDKVFMDHFAAEWWKEYARFRNISIEGLRPEDLRGEFYKGLGTLEKDYLFQIFHTSPTSLYYFLFPKEGIESSPVSISPRAYFLFPFLADMLIRGPLDGKGVEIKLEVNYGDLKNIKGQTKIVRPFRTGVHAQMFSPKVPPLGIIVPPKSTLTLRLPKKVERGESHADNS